MTGGFCVISGGPGTGKTTTVAKILALLSESGNGETRRIALAAPTGKAAARLRESIIGWKKRAERDPAGFGCSEKALNSIPEKASTIHRLLGGLPDSPYFRHNTGNRLPVDAVVVDESSMVDMALMSKLVQAIPDNARLILLGDKDQLSSVEAGAALGDICAGDVRYFSDRFRADFEDAAGCRIDGPTADGPGIYDSIVQLQKSWRFGYQTGIAEVSRAVNSGTVDSRLIKRMKKKTFDDIGWKSLVLPGPLKAGLGKTIVRGYTRYLRASDPAEIFQLFDKFRILCALRGGPYGVNAINRLAERILREERLINPSKKWYAGRPVLITRNNYNLRLFNGDVGITLPDPESDHDFRVFFPDGGGGVRKIHPYRLPDHETVFAMTVHKSQGSEFDEVVLVLPDRDSPVLSRELVYTGITRARNRVEIWGNEKIFSTAVSRRIERNSGLRDLLWQ